MLQPALKRSPGDTQQAHTLLQTGCCEHARLTISPSPDATSWAATVQSNHTMARSYCRANTPTTHKIQLLRMPRPTCGSDCRTRAQHADRRYRRTAAHKLHQWHVGQQALGRGEAQPILNISSRATAAAQHTQDSRGSTVSITY